jgi:uncharacterized membrane protein (DUF2068 family)
MRAAAKPEPRFGMLRVIALYKLIKVILLLATAYEVVRLHDANILGQLYNWMAALPSGPERRIVNNTLQWFSGLSRRELGTLRAASLLYATLFSIEGIGLWMRRRWAEWMTSIVTGSLIPLEFWEIWERPSFGKTAVIVVNLAIVWYLVARILHDRRSVK